MRLARQLSEYFNHQAKEGVTVIREAELRGIQDTAFPGWIASPHTSPPLLSSINLNR
jgi:hypothetical protein